jgi:IS30 family transposase
MGRFKCITPHICMRTHFTFDERLQLQKLHNRQKIRNRRILAQMLQKSESTIRRELKRGWIRHVQEKYPFERWECNAEHAESNARGMDSAKGPDCKIGHDRILLEALAHLIRELHYSPYAAIQHMQMQGWPTDTRICEKTLYSCIYEGLVPSVTGKDLLLEGRRRKLGTAPRKHSNANAAARSISRRPDEADSRQTAGHWETDTVVSAASVVRKLDIIEHQLGPAAFRRLFRSITFDTGSEFSDVVGLESSAITRACRTTLYYAHPYTACETGANENHNGIIRRLFPKGTAFSEVKDKVVRRMHDWMNLYPRRILGGETPLSSLRKDIGLIPLFLAPRYGG